MLREDVERYQCSCGREWEATKRYRPERILADVREIPFGFMTHHEQRLHS